MIKKLKYYVNASILRLWFGLVWFGLVREVQLKLEKLAAGKKRQRKK